MKHVFLFSLVFAACAPSSKEPVHPPPDAGTLAVVSTIPLADAAGVAADATVSVTFSAPMLPAAATSLSVLAGGAPLDGAVSVEGSTLRFRPAQPLAAGGAFSARVRAGAAATDGTSLSADFTWSFTTAAPAPRLAAPTLQPANGTTGVGALPVVTATFAAPLDASTIALSVASGATTVGGTVALAGNAITFTPSQALSAGVTYTATVPASVRGANGETLAAAVRWSFTTGAAPALLSSVPADGATGVSATAPVSFTFSQPLDPASVDETTFLLATSDGIPIDAAVSVAGATAVLLPAAPLAPKMTYKAALSGARNQAGFALATTATATFTTADGPQVTAVTPGAGAASIGVAPTVTFSDDMDPATLTSGAFQLVGPDGPVDGAVSYANRVATFTPSAPLAYSAQYSVIVGTGAADASGTPLAVEYDGQFTTGDQPAVLGTTPGPGPASILVTPSATFSEDMDPATINARTVTLSSASGVVAGLVSYANDVAVFAPLAPLAPSTQYTLTVLAAASSSIGNALGADAAFTFSTAALPSLSATSPLAGATGVDVSVAPAITFSEAMDASTINAQHLTLRGPAGPVAGAVALSGAVATLTPDRPLAASTGYTVTVTSAVRSALGNPLAQDATFSFTTAAPATPAPTVAGTTPSGAAPVTSAVTATFSTQMSASTIDAQTFTLASASGAVAGTVALSGLVATFTPAQPLAYATTYTATVKAAAADLTGHAMAADVAWTFTTGAAVAVAGVSPAAGAGDVPANTAVTLTFAAPMQAAPLQAAFSLAGPSGPVAGAAAVSGSTLTFTPSAPLAAAATYRIAVAHGVPDALGDTLAADYASTFTTAAPATLPGGVLLDGWGGLHPFGNFQLNTANAPYWKGWDIARSLVVRQDGSGGWELDGYGGIHAFGAAPPINPQPVYWSGWDIARALVVLADEKSGYVLDGYGGVHAFGNAPVFTGTPYWSGWDIARGIEVHLTNGGVDGLVVLDGFGGLHPVGNVPGLVQPPYYAGYDLYQRVHAVPGGYWAIGRWGIIQPLGAAAGAPLANIADWGTWDIVRDIVPVGASAGTPFDESRALRCPTTGDYCGSDQLRGGTSVLYHCTAAGAAPSSFSNCASGCLIKPAGTNDVCQQPPPPPPPTTTCDAAGAAALHWEAAQLAAGNSYSDLCLEFVNHAFAYGAHKSIPELGGATAAISMQRWQAEGKLNPWTGANPPCGAIVYWAATAVNSWDGHIVISNGDGTVSTSGWPGFRGSPRMSITQLSGYEGRRPPAGWVSSP